jgi:heterodisulfide reductase subunit A
VCCTYAIGQAKDLKRRYPNMNITIHYMDLRAAYRGFEEFYKEAQEMGIKFVRGRISSVQKDDDDLLLRSENVDLGEPMEYDSDLVILAVGQEPHEGANKIAELLELPLAANGFVKPLPTDYTFDHGVSVIGCALGPRGIRYSVKEAINSVDEIVEYFNKNAPQPGSNEGQERSTVDVDENANAIPAQQITEPTQTTATTTAGGGE